MGDGRPWTRVRCPRTRGTERVGEIGAHLVWTVGGTKGKAGRSTMRTLSGKEKGRVRGKVRGVITVGTQGIFSGIARTHRRGKEKVKERLRGALGERGIKRGRVAHFKGHGITSPRDMVIRGFVLIVGRWDIRKVNARRQGE